MRAHRFGAQHRRALVERKMNPPRGAAKVRLSEPSRHQALRAFIDIGGMSAVLLQPSLRSARHRRNTSHGV